jgi:cold shock CspA family protein
MQITKQGVIEYYDPLRGFGFIIVKNGDGSLTKFFVHKSQLLNATPKTNSVVRFIVGEIPPGRTLALAEKVIVLKNKVSPVAVVQATQTEGRSGGAL